MADAFDDENENEQTYTMNEYMEKLEAEELVTVSSIQVLFFNLWIVDFGYFDSKP